MNGVHIAEAENSDANLNCVLPCPVDLKLQIGIYVCGLSAVCFVLAVPSMILSWRIPKYQIRVFTLDSWREIASGEVYP